MMLLAGIVRNVFWLFIAFAIKQSQVRPNPGRRTLKGLATLGLGQVAFCSRTFYCYANSKTRRQLRSVTLASIG